MATRRRRKVSVQQIEADMEKQRRRGIPSARRLDRALRTQPIGRASRYFVPMIQEFHASLRTFVVEEAAREPSFSGYLETFDEVIEAESQYFEGLPSGLVSSLAAVMDGTGLLSEMLAYDQLLRSKEDDDKKKEKKKKAASSLKEELSAILPSWWPSWLEKIIESILALL